MFSWLLRVRCLFVSSERIFSNIERVNSAYEIGIGGGWF